VEQGLCPLPCLGGGDADEGDGSGTQGRPGHGEWLLPRSVRGGAVREGGDKPQDSSVL
jgi:hypothetical protein